MIFYGYRADGAVTGIVFFLIFIFSVYTILKKSYNPVITIICGLFGLLMAYLAYHKIMAVEAEKLTYTHINPMVSAAFAGAHQGIGLYVLGIAGVGIFLSVFTLITDQKLNRSADGLPLFTWGKFLSPRYLIPFFVIVIGFAATFLYYDKTRPVITLESIRPVINADVSKMGESLSNGEYDRFIDFNHLIMVQSLGGRAKMKELIKSTMEGFKEKGTTISRIDLQDIVNMAVDSKIVQAIITQKVYYHTEGHDVEDLQKLIAVSNDYGATWQYINITGKTKADMIKFFPELNPTLEF